MNKDVGCFRRNAIGKVFFCVEPYGFQSDLGKKAKDLAGDAKDKICEAGHATKDAAHKGCNKVRRVISLEVSRKRSDTVSRLAKWQTRSVRRYKREWTP